MKPHCKVILCKKVHMSKSQPQPLKTSHLLRSLITCTPNSSARPFKSSIYHLYLFIYLYTEKKKY